MSFGAFVFSKGAGTLSAQRQKQWLESPSPDMMSMFLCNIFIQFSVCVITVRHLIPTPFPSKSAPQIAGGRK